MELKLRQIVPLAILHSAESSEIKGRTRMMKLAFLTEERLVQEDIDLNETVELEFYPYDYGPFSKVLLEDLEYLESNNIIDIQESQGFKSKRYDYELTPLGQNAFTQLLHEDDRVQTITEVAKEIVDEYSGLSTRNLLDYVYEEYPEYREKSVYY